MVPNNILTAAELRSAWLFTSKIKPRLEEDCEFDLENCKEVMLFLQFLWKDYKPTAHGLD